MKQYKLKIIFWMFPVMIVFILFFLPGCETDDDETYAVYGLYVTDTYNGNVYVYDFETQTCSGSFLFSTGQRATGAIYFYKNTGYICVGAYENTPGLYCFNPESPNIITCRIGNAISAQYIAFYSSTKAYVTDANYGISTGVYTFNPSDSSGGLSGPITGTYDILGEMYLQDITVGGDGYIYAADNGKNQVIKINPVTDTVYGTYNTIHDSPTGLLEGERDGSQVIYIVNTGNYGADDGSIDSLDCSTGVVTTVAEGLVNPTLAVYDPASSTFFVTGWSNTYSIDASGNPPWIVSEIKWEGSSFGGSSILLHNGLVYITNAGFPPGPYNSKLYVIDVATWDFTGYSPVSVMNPDTDGASGMAVYTE
jgi:hypothetical protein